MGRRMTFDIKQLTEPTEVIVTINGQTASKRTRNRVREHGDKFIAIPNKNRDNQILLKGINDKGWNGWLPLNEIKIFIAPSCEHPTTAIE
jgi:hypothetical protein